MRESELTQLTEKLQRLESKRSQTQRKLRDLQRQVQQERWRSAGELVALAGLLDTAPETLFGGLCELAMHVTDAATAERWHAAGDARLAAYRRRKAHRKTSAPPFATSDPTSSPCEGCDRAIPNHMVELRELESQWVVDASSERMGLLARGTFGEMVEIPNLHHSAHKEPLHDPYYANQSPVDNDI